MDISRMVKIYSLRRYLDDNPAVLKMGQSLSLDESKPEAGLSLIHGLYGSDVWWKNIENGVIESKCCEGKIRELYYAGMEEDIIPNSIIYCNEIDGQLIEDGMWANNPIDEKLYQVGHYVRFIYIKKHYKDQTSMFCPLEVYISKEPI